MLKKRIMGQTGLEVSELSLGGLFISSYASDRATAADVIQRAWELGVNYIDTAPGYLDSESALGEGLAKFDNDFIISTKIGYNPEPFEAQNKDFLRRAAETSLKNLRRDSVDILMIHEPDRYEDPKFFDWWTDKDNFDGPVMEVLKEFQEEGKTKFLGLGGTTAYELPLIMDTGKFDVVLNAFQYNLLWREAEEKVIPTARARNMGLVCGSPLHQGALATVYENDVLINPPRWLNPPRRKQFARLYGFLKDIKIGLPELCIRFLLSNPNVSSVLTGVRCIEELESNVAAAEKGVLPEDLLKEIDNIAAMVPFRPYLEPLAPPFKS
jgi:aryl-alcohol dehydrogenase-like predicted oxidoreductase